MWQLIATWVITAVLAYALRPKPKAQAPASPATIEDVDAPTAQEGKEIPVLFGTRKISAPNVVWYGDLDTTPIEQCQTTKSGGFFGLFSSSSTQCSIVGYKYYLGVHFVLSHGPIDSLNRIDVMERTVWTAPGPSVEACDILGRDISGGGSGGGDAARTTTDFLLENIHTVIVTTLAPHGISDGEILEFGQINGTSFAPELSNKTYVAGSLASNRFRIYTNVNMSKLTDEADYQASSTSDSELYTRSSLVRAGAQKTISAVAKVGTATRLTVTAHGYANGMRLYVYFGYRYRIDGSLIAGLFDVRGVFTISGVTANTLDIPIEITSPNSTFEWEAVIVPKSGSGSDFGFVDGVA